MHRLPDNTRGRCDQAYMNRAAHAVLEAMDAVKPGVRILLGAYSIAHAWQIGVCFVELTVGELQQILEGEALGALLLVYIGVSGALDSCLKLPLGGRAELPVAVHRTASNLPGEALVNVTWLLGKRFPRE